MHSCSSSSRSRGKSPKNPIVLDTIELDYGPAHHPPYKIAPSIEIDVVHIELDLRFNWEKEEVIGKAKILLSAFNKAQDTIRLDARGFELLTVNHVRKDTSYTPVYVYDGSEIAIVPKVPLEAGDTTTIIINYIARPSLLDVEEGTAITSNQGLYFINPRGEIRGKPRQLWTQGEPECNSSWFPSVDHPHEKITHEIFLTVDSSLHTISNGKLIYSSVNEDGTRTDYWKQSLPHSNYLVMIAVGEFSLIKDQWRDKPVWYYVDSAYASEAMNIFGNTPEMLEFYSNKLGVDYPWEKYHQVVVKDFVSGAMENTSAVIHGDFVQLTERELLDESHEDVIAHELFHHWFGDLITCKDWSQLTMNEGFATYGEFLWMEHKYGIEEARHHLKQDLDIYLSDAQGDQKPLIRHHYFSPDDIFDSHTYQKGGRVLHLLRMELGDDVFFATLNHYLTTYAYGSVQVHDFQRSAEIISGRSLSWFFDQWFNRSGHPVVLVDYQESPEELHVIISQQQNLYSLDEPFQFHLDVAIGYPDGHVETKRIWVNELSDTNTIKLNKSPSWYCVDPKGEMLWQAHENKSSTIWENQLLNAPSFISKENALVQLFELDSLKALTHSELLLSDSFWLIRAYGVELLTMSGKWSESIKAQLIELTQLDPKSYVRAAAYSAIDSLSHGNKEFNQLFTYGLKDQSYEVVRACLASLYSIDVCYASEQVGFLECETNESVRFWVSRIYAACGGLEKSSYFKTNTQEAKGFDLFLLLNDYATFAKRQGNAAVYSDLTKQMTSSGLGEDSWWVKNACIRGLANVQAYYLAEINKIESSKESTLDQMEELSKLRAREAELTNTINEITILQDQSGPSSMLNR